MKVLGNEFLRGYIELAEGEKDPRNLLLAFSIARVILIEFDISNYVDVRLKPSIDMKFTDTCITGSI